jgi:putative transposase
LLIKACKVTRSGYYKWLKSDKIRQAEEEIKAKVIYLYNKYKGIYGYRRLKISYNQEYGEIINHKKIYRIMRQMGLKSKIRRKRKVFTSCTPIIRPNILNQNFKAEKKNKKWVTDITNLYYNNTRIYLSVIMDLYNLEVVSYFMSRKKDNHLVSDTLSKAIRGRKELEETILHSDQGSQYTTEHYSNLLEKAGIQQSMSRRGNCLDNAPVECFFSHLKSELIYTTKFSSEQEMIEAVKQYINFYNNERIQLKLKNLPPVTYRLLGERVITS